MAEPSPISSELAPEHDAPDPAPGAHPALGYAMLVASACLFAVNGTVSKVVLASSLSSARLTEIRTTGAFLVLLLLVLALRPRALLPRRAELPLVLLFGLVGLALTQWLYFLAIHRLDVGVALVLEFTAPILVAVVARFVFHQPVRDRVFASIVLALAGLTLVVQLWSGFALDGAGTAAGLGAAVALAVYYLSAERVLSGGRDPLSLACLGFFVAAVFFALVQPWWTFPFGTLGTDVSLLGRLGGTHLPAWSLVLWVIVPGTVAPFLLSVASLRHLPVTRAAVVSMLEPVIASVVAYAWLGESLAPSQLVGGAIVLVGVVLAQTAR